MRLVAQFNDGIWKSDDLANYEFVHNLAFDQGLLRLTERAIRRIQRELRLPYVALFDTVRFALACRRQLAGFDLLYERMGWMGYGGSVVSHWLQLPLVLEVNGDHLSEMEALGIAPKGAQQRLSTWLTRWAVRQASCAVATGQGWRQRHIDRWQVAPEMVKVIENGSEILDLLPRESLRSFAYQGDPHTTNVIYVGGFEPWHGLSVLIRAAARVIADGVSLKIVLAGSGPEERNIKQTALELGIASHVVFSGHLAPRELAQCLSEADIGVSPYCGRVEYSGLKLLDYKAAGLATIASGREGQPAILEHGRTGWIVPPCDEEALCRALLRLSSDLDLRKRIGRAARLEAEQQHSWRHTAEQLDQLFRRLLTT
jgi:glycosyltransferase involved in cell wall biosynthesis